MAQLAFREDALSFNSRYLRAFFGDREKAPPIFLDSPDEELDRFIDEHGMEPVWPENAVMAIAFTEEAFGFVGRKKLPYLVYYAIDGWPIGLESALRRWSPIRKPRKLPEHFKHMFQAFPIGWADWEMGEWVLAIYGQGAYL